MDEQHNADEEHHEYDCKCLRKIIKQRMRRTLTYPLTERQVLWLCIYQYMILLVTYLFIMEMNTVEHFLQIFNPDEYYDTIFGLISKTMKIMMMLHLVEETRILLKALLCKCDTY